MEIIAKDFPVQKVVALKRKEKLPHTALGILDALAILNTSQYTLTTLNTLHHTQCNALHLSLQAEILKLQSRRNTKTDNKDSIRNFSLSSRSSTLMGFFG